VGSGILAFVPVSDLAYFSDFTYPAGASKFFTADSWQLPPHWGTDYRSALSCLNLQNVAATVCAIAGVGTCVACTAKAVTADSWRTSVVIAIYVRCSEENDYWTELVSSDSLVAHSISGSQPLPLA
jgi:hypothetical protein